MKAGPFSARRQASVATHRAFDDAPPRHDAAADPDGGDRAGHRAIGQPAGKGQALSQSDDPREAVDDLEAVRDGLGNQEATIVRAEIERSKNRPASVGTLDRFEGLGLIQG